MKKFLIALVATCVVGSYSFAAETTAETSSEVKSTETTTQAAPTEQAAPKKGKHGKHGKHGKGKHKKGEESSM